MKVKEQFGVVKKGAYYENYFDNQELEDDVLYVMLDTGNENAVDLEKYPNVIVLDHHQFSNAEKKQTLSATHLLLKRKNEYMDKAKGYSKIKYITHDNPDVDAVNSVTLAHLYREIADMSKIDTKTRRYIREMESQLVVAANDSDTFVIRDGFTYQRLLDRFIRKEYPRFKDKADDEISTSIKNETINMFVQLNSKIVKENAMRATSGKKESINDTIKRLINETSAYPNRNRSDIFTSKFSSIKDCVNEIKNDDIKDEKTYKELMKNYLPARKADKFINRKEYAHDKWKCNIPLKNGDIKEIEANEGERNYVTREGGIFLVDGSSQISPGVLGKVLNSGLQDIVISLSREKSGKIISISCNRQTASLGSFNKLLEAMIIRERLQLSKLENAAEQERDKLLNKQIKYIKSLKRNPNADKGENEFIQKVTSQSHFLKGSIDRDSELSSYSNIKKLCQDYFSRPYEIGFGKFLDLIVGGSEEGLNALARIDEMHGSNLIGKLSDYYEEQEQQNEDEMNVDEAEAAAADLENIEMVDNKGSIENPILDDDIDLCDDFQA